MSASFQTFLTTGQLGPLVLGMAPAAVEIQLGEPQARSRKSKPLLLKYGPLELAFWSGRSQPPQLSHVSLSLQHGLHDLPPAVTFDDWLPNSGTTLDEFQKFLTRIGAQPESIARGQSESAVVMPSGVRASFLDGHLNSISLSKSEKEQSRQPILNHEIEPSSEQIQGLLQQARTALNSSLVSAAVLLAWGALEAALRRTAIDAGYEGKVRAQANLLIRELYARGRLSKDDVGMLEFARQKRTNLAHGLVSDSIDDRLVLNIIQVTERLLGSHYRTPQPVD